jgi:hypothetical protein
MEKGWIIHESGFKLFVVLSKQAGKTKNSIRYSFKEDPKFVLLSQNRNRDFFRIEFLLKNKKFTQSDLIGISEKKYKIPIWIEV